MSSNLPLSTYDWELNPATAGNLLVNEYQAEVEWDDDFTGSAMLKVMATNDCGSSEWSEELQINVINTTGIGSLEQNLGVEIYPNPNKGSFTLEMNTAQDTYVNIYIFSGNNAKVYELNNIHLTGNWTRKIDLSSLSSGMYTIRIESREGSLSKQIIIRE